MIKIAPSILASDFSKLGSEVESLEAAGADMVHFDIMDGQFVPNITIGAPVVKALRKITNLPFDVHLMIKDPDKYIDSFIEAGADNITVHAEACTHLDRTVKYILSNNCTASVALNPATSLSVLDWCLEGIDMVLIMTVNPGFGGQSFINSMTDKIYELRKRIKAAGLNTDIQVDGGITDTTVDWVSRAGANVMVAGSAVFGAKNKEAMISSLRNKAYEVFDKYE